MQINTNSQNKNHLNAIPKRLIQLFSKAIAKLLLKFNVSKHDYDHYLNEQMVLEAKRQNPKISQVEIAVRTGIDRRYIAAYLKGEMPKVKSNKLFLILNDLKWTLDKYYDGGKKLPKRGPFKSFESICEEWSSGSLTYRSILSELVRIGSVIDHGKKVELVQVKINQLKENNDFFEMSSNLMNRISNTIISNSELQNLSDQYFQMTAFSTQIPPQNIKNVKVEIKEELRLANKKAIEILEKYEEKVEPETYEPYGVSFLEFNDNEETK